MWNEFCNAGTVGGFDSETDEGFLKRLRIGYRVTGNRIGALAVLRVVIIAGHKHVPVTAGHIGNGVILNNNIGRSISGTVIITDRVDGQETSRVVRSIVSDCKISCNIVKSDSITGTIGECAVFNGNIAYLTQENTVTNICKSAILDRNSIQVRGFLFLCNTSGNYDITAFNGAVDLDISNVQFSKVILEHWEYP